MESEEKRWRLTEQALRRLVGRLCAAGMGVDPQLDDELITLAAANRRNADTTELEKLAESLTSAVVAVDAVAPVPTVVLPTIGKRWDSTCAAVAKILQCLRPVLPEEAAVPELIVRLTKANSDGELAVILAKTEELVRAHSDAIASERLQAAALLADVTTRLEEMAAYLSVSGDEARSHFSDTASVNDDVVNQVRDLTAEVNSATELRTLQTLVTNNLEVVTRKVLEFRSREAKRLAEQTDRTERMRLRVADLEREALELQSKLNQEKFGARHNPLTLVANRKSFDERLAQIMLGQAQGALPVAMLLWDLDNFKLINDSYGHRAGDRVLKSVATCFVSGLRAEDFVARIGGEEFIILLTGLTFAKAQQIAEELRLGVAALRFHFRGTPVRVTASCGLTELQPDDTGSAAFDRADAALYRAKHNGKNQCVPV